MELIEMQQITTTGGNESTMDFRSFEETDLLMCAEISAKAWSAVLNIINQEDAVKFMQSYIEYCLMMSDYTQVCLDGNKVIGLLFGSEGKDSKRKLSKEEQLKKRQLLWKIATGEYGKVNNRMRFLTAFIISEIKVKFYCLKFDSEVVLFIVDKEYQGRGIGRKLLSDFLNYSRDNGSKTIFLYTDIESNWRFYEMFGFEKIREFHDNGLSVMTGKKTMSFIYRYKL